MELRRRGVQFTEHLAKEFGITAGIAIQKENEVVIVDMKNFNAEQAPSSNMGFRDPIYCTAIGKILLAINAQENEVLRIIGSDFPLKKYTVNTIIHKEALLQELNDCRKKGYAIDNEESLEGLRCVAVPIFDNTNKAIAALYVSSMWNYSIETLTGKVLESCQLAAASLSKEMGCLSYFANIEAIKNREC
jgi:DNA-binding IclR family transcriptional regulator